MAKRGWPPKTVKIRGDDYTVVASQEVSPSEDLAGLCRVPKRELRYWKGSADSHALKTLLHEIGHAYWYDEAIDIDGELEEKLVNWWAESFLDLYRNTPRFWW